MEKWKDIPGYEGLYQVSTEGRVKSLERIVIRRNGYPLSIKEVILKKQEGTKGYYQVGLWNGGRVLKAIHQLVAMAFLGHEPNGYEIVVDHINNNPLDNRLENLQLISNRENSIKEPKGKSKYAGVTWDSHANKWKSRIRINNKRIHLGMFDNEEDAAAAYQHALQTKVH